MSSAYQQILRLLPEVKSEEEKKNIRVLLGTALQSSSSSVQKLQSRYQAGNADGDWLFEGIVAELARRGLIYRKPKEVCDRLLSYAEDATFVRGHLLKGLKVLIPQPKRVQLTALGTVSARALADYLYPVRPLGLKFLLNNVGKTLEAVDRSFPGYLGAGMIGVLIKRDVAGTLHGN